MSAPDPHRPLRDAARAIFEHALREASIPKAFARHLVSGPPSDCAAGLRRFADAGARHIVVMVAASPAVDHFGLIRAAFAAEMETAMAEVQA